MFKSRKFEDQLVKIQKKLMIKGNDEKSLTSTERKLLQKKPTQDELHVTTIDLKYCEKVYNRKIKKYKPKQKTTIRENYKYNKK